MVDLIGMYILYNLEIPYKEFEYAKKMKLEIQPIVYIPSSETRGSKILSPLEKILKLNGY